MLAIGTRDPAAGASLLFVYALGMGLPFVLSGFLFAKMIGTFSFVKRHFGAIKIASGTLLILFGLLLATGQIEVMTEWMRGWLPAIRHLSLKSGTGIALLKKRPPDASMF